VAVEEEARGLESAGGGQKAWVEIAGRVDGERFWVGGHDGFEVLVVGVEGRGGDCAGLESLLDRSGDADDWDDGNHAVGCLLWRLW
jgi:hypothetical protein